MAASQISASNAAGIPILASRLQHAILSAAFAELGLHGPAQLSTWCQGLGRFGMSSLEVRELFQALDMDQTGEVEPEAYCNAARAREAFVDSLRSSLDLVRIVQMRYRLLLFGSHSMFTLTEASRLTSVELLDVCEKLDLVVSDAEVKALLDAVHSQGFFSGKEVSGGFAPTVSLGEMCHQLAIWSTSAAKLNPSSLETVKKNSRMYSSGSFLAEEDVACQHYNDPGFPTSYIGKTPVEIVVLLKDPAKFPWHRLPEAVCGRRFEELWELRRVHQVAEEAVRLLLEPAFDRRCRHGYKVRAT